MRFEPGTDEHLDFPGEMPWPDRAAAEIAAGRDADPGLLRHADDPERLLQKHGARSFGFGETTTIGRGEADEALEHAEGRDECRVPGHLRGRRGVDSESVLDGIDSRLDGNRGAQTLRVRGDALAAFVHRAHSRLELVDRERDLFAGTAGVDRDLYEIRARVHLRDRRFPQLFAGVDEDDEPRELVATREPRPGRDDRRGIDLSAVRVS